MKNKKVPIAIVVVIITILLTARAYLYRGFEYAGTIEATRIDLPSRLPTIIKSLLIEEGQKIKKGDLLAELACEDININYNLTKENFDRASQLKISGSISKESFDQVSSKFQDAKTRLDWCRIISPVDGTILTKFLEPNEWVNPGSKIVSIADLSHLWTYFYVSQEAMSKLKLGSEIEGQIPELNKSFKGLIAKINDEAEFTPKNVQTQSERTRLVFGIKVMFSNENNELKPGMTIVSKLGL